MANYAFAPKEPARRWLPVCCAPPQLVLSEQAGSCCLHVDGARASELLHGFHLRAGDVHVIAAIDNALGQKQVRIRGDECAGNPALVQRAQQLPACSDKTSCGGAQHTGSHRRAGSFGAKA